MLSTLTVSSATPCSTSKREDPHQRHGELLVAAQAGAQRHLRQHRAVPLVPLPRRTSVPLQRAARKRPRPFQAGTGPRGRASPDVRRVDGSVSRAARDPGLTAARTAAARSTGAERIVRIASVNRSTASWPAWHSTCGARASALIAPATLSYPMTAISMTQTGVPAPRWKRLPLQRW